MKAIDLHVHSNKSDGSDTPSLLVDKALALGLRAIAITDHDTVDGLDEAIRYASDKDIEIIPGIELSTEYMGKDVHIVGLYINYKNPDFIKYLDDFKASRIARNEKMCKRLREEAGIDISVSALEKDNPGAVITRAHYAKYMLKNGYVKSLGESFDRYIGDHCRYFVPREKITPEDAIKLIEKCGGLSILAHPILYHLSDANLDTLVKRLSNAGLVGIEAIYSTYSPSEERSIRALAAKYNLKLSGGSDYHGDAKPRLELGTGYGKLCVPEEILDKLNGQYKKIFFSDLDGTLLNDKKEITPKTYKAIQDWMDNGNILVLSSGRPLMSVSLFIRICISSDLTVP